MQPGRSDGEYGRLSAWRDTVSIDAAAAHVLVERLELRARAADEIAAREEYLGLLDVAPGERVLDAGCGSGVVTRELARRVAPGGRAMGVDQSPALLAEARRLAIDARLDGIEFREGSVLALPFPDGAFDAVLAATVLSHVPGAERAIPELVRVVRPGGRVGIFDFDADTFVIDHPDRALTRRVVAAAADHAAVDGWLMRRLPALLARAGLVDVRVRAYMPLDADPAGFYPKLAERSAGQAAEMGLLTEAERARWVADYRSRQAAGGGLAGRLHLFIWGRRPDSP